MLLRVYLRYIAIFLTDSQCLNGVQTFRFGGWSLGFGDGVGDVVHVCRISGHLDIIKQQKCGAMDRFWICIAFVFWQNLYSRLVWYSNDVGADRSGCGALLWPLFKSSCQLLGATSRAMWHWRFAKFSRLGFPSFPTTIWLADSQVMIFSASNNSFWRSGERVPQVCRISHRQQNFASSQLLLLPPICHRLTTPERS